ncbi:MAG: methionine biosynthesis protein MetW, partial [Kiloniellales bacterium]
MAVPPACECPASPYWNKPGQQDAAWRSLPVAPRGPHTLAMSAHPARTHGEVLHETLSLSGLRVLDIGCGDGSLVRLMTRQSAKATGLEIS